MSTENSFFRSPLLKLNTPTLHVFPSAFKIAKLLLLVVVLNYENMSGVVLITLETSCKCILLFM